MKNTISACQGEGLPHVQDPYIDLERAGPVLPIKYESKGI